MKFENLPLFFASISINKVHPDLRPKILRYQKECAKALWDYWTRGSVRSSRMKEVATKDVGVQAYSAYLRGRLEQMQDCILTTKSRWRSIFRYRSLGLNDYEISRILGISLGKLAVVIFEMQRSGLVLPEKSVSAECRLVHPETLMIEDYQAQKA